MDSYAANNQYQAPTQPQYSTAPMYQGPPVQPQYGSAPIYQGEPQGQYKDPEYQNNIENDLSYSVRKGFIVKTYGIL